MGSQSFPGFQLQENDYCNELPAVIYLALFMNFFLHCLSFCPHSPTARSILSKPIGSTKTLPALGKLSKSMKVLCLVRAASGPFLESNLFLLKVGLRWVLSMGCNGSKSGLLGSKVGEKWVETYFPPTLSPVQDFREDPLFTQFKGGGKLFSRKAPEAGPTQHNESCTSENRKWLRVCFR